MALTVPESGHGWAGGLWRRAPRSPLAMAGRQRSPALGLRAGTRLSLAAVEFGQGPVTLMDLRFVPSPEMRPKDLDRCIRELDLLA